MALLACGYNFCLFRFLIFHFGNSGFPLKITHFGYDQQAYWTGSRVTPSKRAHLVRGSRPHWDWPKPGKGGSKKDTSKHSCPQRPVAWTVISRSGARQGQSMCLPHIFASGNAPGWTTDGEIQHSLSDWGCIHIQTKVKKATLTWL